MNKDLPSTWISFKKNLCDTCIATCCTMPAEVKASDLVRLKLATAEDLEANSKKVAKEFIRAGILSSYREKTGLFTLARKANGDCVNLDENRKCKVYELRPDVCRSFPEKMGRRLNHCPYIKK